MSLPFVGAHGDPHKARYLLRLDEIMLRGGGKRGAFQRDDTLITLTRYCLVESDRTIAFTEQGKSPALGRLFGPALRTIFYIAAQLAALIIANQKFDEAIFGMPLQFHMLV